MNRARVAALLRELADEVERSDAPPAPKSKPRKRRAPVVVEMAPPSDTDRAEARRLLRARGKLVEG